MYDDQRNLLFEAEPLGLLQLPLRIWSLIVHPTRVPLKKTPLLHSYERIKNHEVIQNSDAFKVRVAHFSISVDMTQTSSIGHWVTAKISQIKIRRTLKL